MAKKTVIKRASKQWPQSSGRERLDEAVVVVNEHEGLTEDFLHSYTADQHAEMRGLLDTQNGIGYLAFASTLDDRTKSDLFNSSEKGKKTALKSALRELEKEGHVHKENAEEQLADSMSSDNSSSAAEIMAELLPAEQEYFYTMIDVCLVEWTLQAIEDIAA